MPNGIFGFKPNTILADALLTQPTGNEAHWRRKLANQGSISKARPSLAGRLESAAVGALRKAGVSDKRAARLGSKAFAAVNDLTPVGNATTAADAGTQLGQGNVLAGAGLSALAMLPGAAGRGLRAYHVSPHDFDRFSLAHLGSGEGAQRYGRGLYFATNKDGPTTQHYRNFFGPKAKTYEANLGVAPDQLLNWDMPAWEQPENVKALLNRVDIPTAAPSPKVRQTKSGRFTALNQWGESIGTFASEDAATNASMKRLRESLGTETGGLLYSRLGGNLYYPQLDDGRATAALRDSGVLGARYLTPVGDENIVVYDDALIDILNKF